MKTEFKALLCQIKHVKINFKIGLLVIEIKIVNKEYF